MPFTSRLVQVTNVSTSVLKDQLKTLFSHVGRVEDIQLYPESETLVSSVGAKVCYIRFERPEIAQAALNLTNTVFLDRAIICNLVKPPSSSSSSSSRSSSSSLYQRIPDETESVKYCPPLNTNVTLIPGGVTWPHTVVNRMITAAPIAGLEHLMTNTAHIETIGIIINIFLKKTLTFKRQTKKLLN